MQRQNAFFTSEKPIKYHVWSYQYVCDSLVADLFMFCYERDFMMSLSDDKQADIIDA